MAMSVDDLYALVNRLLPPLAVALLALATNALRCWVSIAKVN